jgi:two-component system chemotaxis response regulator CheB
MVIIGSSTGGPQALQTILKQLPSDFPTPILCIQHIAPGFLNGLVNWLRSLCSMKVKIAQDGELPLAGTIYFPQEGTHLLVDKKGRLVSSLESPLDGHRPSITLTLKSAADYYGKAAVGILLTGMGRDGADGMKAIAKAGGITMVQDEKSSIVFGMPKQAIELGAAQYVLPLDEIANVLITKILLEKSLKRDIHDIPEKIKRYFQKRT